MPQVVQPDWREAEPPPPPARSSTEPLRMLRAARPTRRRRGRRPRTRLRRRAAPAAVASMRARVQRPSTGQRRLAGAPSPVLGVPHAMPGSPTSLNVGGDQCPRDAEPAGVEVDVRPPQAEHFAAAHPGCREQPPSPSERSVRDVGEESCQLCAGPGLISARSRPGWVGCIRGVADDRVPPHGVPQRAVQDRRDVRHRARRQRPVFLVAGESEAVERVQVSRTDLLEPSAPD